MSSSLVYKRKQLRDIKQCTVCVRARVCTHEHACACTCMCPCVYVRVRTLRCCEQLRIHACMHANIRPRAHTHTQLDIMIAMTVFSFICSVSLLSMTSVHARDHDTNSRIMYHTSAINRHKYELKILCTHACAPRRISSHLRW